MTDTTIALFPLGTVLFPGGPLPLRIFEPRYLKMISDCMKNERPFGVCLIADGREAGEAAVPHEIGTLAWIEDWNQLDDGHLGVTARGGDRFIVRETRLSPEQLVIGEIEILEEPQDPGDGIEEAFQPLVDILRKALPQAGELYRDMTPHWNDPSWVAFRIAELLPDNDAKLQVLRSDDPRERLAIVDAHLRTHARSE